MKDGNEISQIYAEKQVDRLPRYSPTPHTMGPDALNRYALSTKFSKDQVLLISKAIDRKMAFEVQGVYAGHVDYIIEKMKCESLEVAYRAPRRTKKFNYTRPSVRIVRDFQTGTEKLLLFVFPSREYVHQYAELLNFNIYHLSKEQSRFPEYDGLKIIHYAHCYQSLPIWSGLQKKSKEIIWPGDIACIGHVDEVENALSEMGFNVDDRQEVKNPHGSFGLVTVLTHSNTSCRIVLLGVYESFWGSAAGTIARCLAECGVSHLFYISKAGTFIADEIVHTLVSPTSYAILTDVAEGGEPMWTQHQVPSNLLLLAEKEMSPLLSGVHLTVPSVFGETIDQSAEYAKLRPATIDNEVGYIARELERANKTRPINDKVFFNCMHFITDYLRTGDVDDECDTPNLADVDGERGITVRSAQTTAIHRAASIVGDYTLRKPERLTNAITAPVLSPTGERLFGRSELLDELVETWRSGRTSSASGDKKNSVVLHSIGGSGKTAVLKEFIDRVEREDFGTTEWLFAWSAYSQGSSENRISDASSLFQELEAYFEFDVSEGISKDPIARARLLAKQIGESRTLLVLDGIEPLQHPPHIDEGRIKDKALQRLIVELSIRNAGLLVISSRQPVVELAGFPRKVLDRPLQELDVPSAVELMTYLGCKGTRSELEGFVEELRGHALCLTVLASYAVEMHDGRISECRNLAFGNLAENEAAEGTRSAVKLGKIIDAYIEKFKAGGTVNELCTFLLWLSGLFDRPVDRPSLDKLLYEWHSPRGTNPWLQMRSFEREKNLQVALRRLRKLRLLLLEGVGGTRVIDFHPMIREQFAAQLRSKHNENSVHGHAILFDHYRILPFDGPSNSVDTYEDSLRAIQHGCYSDKHYEAFQYIWTPRIAGNDNHFFHKLGAYSAGLTALSSFFDSEWIVPSAKLDEAAKSEVLNYAGFLLKSTGRPKDAEGPMRRNFENDVRQKRWRHASIQGVSFAELLFDVGRIGEALDVAQVAVDCADKSEDLEEIIDTRTVLASIHDAMNNQDLAKDLFDRILPVSLKDWMQGENVTAAMLWRYFVYLIDQGAFQKAENTLRNYFRDRGFSEKALHRGLELLALSVFCDRSGSEISSFLAFDPPLELEGLDNCFAEAIQLLRLAGQVRYLATGLLHRASCFAKNSLTSDAISDFEEALRIAQDGDFISLSLEVQVGVLEAIGDELWRRNVSDDLFLIKPEEVAGRTQHLMLWKLNERLSKSTAH